jgi:hypothetical protein
MKFTSSADGASAQSDDDGLSDQINEGKATKHKPKFTARSSLFSHKVSVTEIAEQLFLTSQSP